jgi:hypothetical protein
VAKPEKYMDFKVPPLLRVDDDNETPGGRRGISVISSLSSQFFFRVFLIITAGLYSFDVISHFSAFNGVTIDLLHFRVTPLSADTALQTKARMCDREEWELRRVGSGLAEGM